MLTNISSIDGRYFEKTRSLEPFFSEHALFKYRVKVEILYFIQLIKTGVLNINLDKVLEQKLNFVYQNYTVEDSKKIKEFEKTTKHDIKAVEYFVKEKLQVLGLDKFVEFVHFGLTSQDINNTAFPLLLKDASEAVVIPFVESLINDLIKLIEQIGHLPMLARTHGQPASPTTLGKEISVFVERLEAQLKGFKKLNFSGKFGGATGNLNAHKVAFPNINWPEWCNVFLNEKLGILRQQTTTQIAHYDEIAEWCHVLIRINTVLLDFCKDIWTYISMDYFKQKIIKGEIGSSAMPHKVNPIDFENAEGNLSFANAMLSFLAEKLPISRLQRDLTDSTVLRNVGTPVGHMLISFQSIAQGLSKLEVNRTKVLEELNSHWIVLAEAIQTVLRREGYDQPYEKLKELTRGKTSISQEDLIIFIDNLDVKDSLKLELKSITPTSYIGYAQ
ncbi:MAG: adenylosuccinate lyase [Saprospiraceae bacterium]|nr:adenylosuccinate lyase [Candidatus Vicinibacter proximus]MBL7824254.1 adenylosuccinate lyase [Saprospiraceae bacterium]MCC6843517.1 adenylosuccinate lyase [Saprospiraceae bacterium]HRG31761.1 adenylosuccinate lyase [Saprospiraceae bacterium]